jgi:uncharacterized membrane protein YoaK (UPF0700 family)
VEEPERRATTAGVTASALLGAVAGFVDAVCLNRLFGVYPANQSGNAILFGVALGEARWSFAWRPATAITGFVAGVALAALVRPRLPGPWQTRILLLVEVVLLALVAAVAGSVTALPGLLDGFEAVTLLLVASIAMGVQTEVIRTHAGVALSTTYETGAMVTVAEHAVDAASGRGGARAAHRRTIVVLLVVLFGYIGGAAAGAHLAGDWGGALLVPLLALVALLVSAPAWMPDPRRDAT